MSRLDKLFKEKGNNICSIFVTAGYPELSSTVHQVIELAENGADLIELGMPFSDPLADGPTIQQTSMQALSNGMNLNILFEQVEEIRKRSNVPIVLMGYINPIINFGVSKFLDKCLDADIDGLILPDISLEEYERSLKQLLEPTRIPLTFLVTPATSKERLQRIINYTDSFVYYVSSASTTGKSSGFSREQEGAFIKYRSTYPDIPTLMGFGIHNSDTFNLACKYFNGGIIGSAYLRAISNGISPKAFLSQVLDYEKV